MIAEENDARFDVVVVVVHWNFAVSQPRYLVPICVVSCTTTPGGRACGEGQGSVDRWESIGTCS